VHQESAVRDVDDLDAVDTFDSIDDLLFMFTGDSVYGDVANDVVTANTNNIDSANVAARLPMRWRLRRECRRESKA